MMTQIMNRIVAKLLKLWGLITALLLAGTRFASADALGILNCPEPDPRTIIDFMARPTCGISGGTFDPDSNCFWFSKALRQIFSAMDQIGSAVYNSLAGTEGNTEFAIPILAVCFGVWLAWQVLRYVGPLHGQAPADFFQIIANGFFRLLVVCCLIKWGASEAFETFIGMFAVAAANVGTDIMLKASQTLDEGGVSNFEILNWDNLSGVMKLHAAVALNMKVATSVFMEIVGMGFVLAQFAFSDGILCILPSIDPLWTGYVLIFAATILVFIIPFKFLDILFRLTLVYALLPMFLMAWVFPSTRKYTMKAWGIVLNAVCLLLIMSVLFALCTGMMSNLVLSGSTDSGALDNAQILYNLFRTDETCEDKNMLLIMLVAIFLSMKSLNLGKQLAGHLSETPSGAVAEGMLNTLTGAVGGRAASAAAASIGLAGSSLLGKASDGMKSLGNRVGGALGGLAGGAAGSLAGAEPGAAGGLTPRFMSRFSKAGAASGGSIASSGAGGAGEKGGSNSSVFNGADSAGAGGGSATRSDVMAKLEGINSQTSDLEKDLADKLSSMNKDIQSDMDHEQKKGLSDMNHALDMAKRDPQDRQLKLIGKQMQMDGKAAELAQQYMRDCEARKNGQPTANTAERMAAFDYLVGEGRDTEAGKAFNKVLRQSNIVEKQIQMGGGKTTELARQYMNDCEARRNGQPTANTADRMAVLDYLANEGRGTETGSTFSHELDRLHAEDKLDPTQLKIVEKQMQMGGGKPAELAQQYMKDCEARENNGNLANTSERMAVFDYLANEGRDTEAGKAFNEELAKLRGGDDSAAMESKLIQDVTNETVAEAVKPDDDGSAKSAAKYDAEEAHYRNEADDDAEEARLLRKIASLMGQRNKLQNEILKHRSRREDLRSDDLARYAGDTDPGEGINTDLAALDENGNPVQKNTDDV